MMSKNDEQVRPSGLRFCPYRGNLQTKSIRLDKAKRDGAGTAGKATAVSSKMYQLPNAQFMAHARIEAA
jgi:hypothetical protein